MNTNIPMLRFFNYIEIKFDILQVSMNISLEWRRGHCCWACGIYIMYYHMFLFNSSYFLDNMFEIRNRIWDVKSIQFGLKWLDTNFTSLLCLWSLTTRFSLGFKCLPSIWLKMSNCNVFFKLSKYWANILFR